MRTTFLRRLVHWGVKSTTVRLKRRVSFWSSRSCRRWERRKGIPTWRFTGTGRTQESHSKASNRTALLDSCSFDLCPCNRLVYSKEHKICWGLTVFTASLSNLTLHSRESIPHTNTTERWPKEKPCIVAIASKTRQEYSRITRDYLLQQGSGRGNSL